MGKEHKKIPQLDGFEDNNILDEKFSQTENTHVKEVEVQTNSFDTTERSSQTEDLNIKQVKVQTKSSDTVGTMKWGEHGHIPLSSDTVVLNYRDYPVLSSPII